jgi:polar amino acid transport system substrate-binding protein
VEIKSRARLASLGWFKTSEREKFAYFSLPVYRNKPESVFVLREEAERFALYRNFKDLMATSHFTIGRIDGYSQGEYLDTVLADYRNRTVWVTGDQVQLIKMLKARRFDFILLPPEEVETLVTSAGHSLQDFALLKMDDIPAGVLRYIMYSKSASRAVIEEIDKAIIAEIGVLELGL